jgi:hypothetical protein
VTPTPHRVRAPRPALWLASAAAALLSLTFIVGSTVDEEEFRFAILSAWLYVDALRHGSLGLWTTQLGLGMPQPFTPNFRMHPLLPLLAVMSPATWARLFLVAHTLLGAAGMWQLTRYLNMTGVVRAVCVATFLLATPAQNYSLTDFWPSHYVVWTSAPWLLLFAWKTLEAEGRPLRFWSVALGVSAGLVIANTNPGHVIVYAVLAGAVVLVHWRQALPRSGWIAIAAGIAVAIASPNLLQLAHERALFSPDLPLGLGDQAEPLAASEIWNVFVSDFSDTDDDRLFTRTLFFGGPFAVLALIGSVRLVRHRLDLTIAVVVAAVLLFTAWVPLPFVSARFQLRDPLTVAAILLAGLSLDHLLTLRRARVVVPVIVAAQMVVLTVAASPAIKEAWTADARRAEMFRGASGETGAVDALVRLAPPPARLVFTPAFDEQVYDTRWVEQGFGVNSLAYRGLDIVNGWFKGVSTDSVWADERMFYGRILAPQQLVTSSGSLDVLGVQYVVARADDTVAADLRKVGVVPLGGDAPLTIYQNGDAFPAAFVVDSDAEHLMPVAFPDCDNSRLLCLDLAPLAGRRLGDRVVVNAGSGTIDIGLRAVSEPRLLIVSQMFRPEWVASAGGARLSTLPIFGGLLGIRVPAGTTDVTVRYRPVPMIAATAAAWVALAGGLLALVVMRKDRGLPLNGAP